MGFFCSVRFYEKTEKTFIIALTLSFISIRSISPPIRSTILSPCFSRNASSSSMVVNSLISLKQKKYYSLGWLCLSFEKIRMTEIEVDPSRGANKARKSCISIVVYFLLFTLKCLAFTDFLRIRKWKCISSIDSIHANYHLKLNVSSHQLRS